MGKENNPNDKEDNTTKHKEKRPSIMKEYHTIPDSDEGVPTLSLSVVIPTKLIRVYGKIFLVPVHEKDAELLKQSTSVGTCTVRIAVEHMSNEELTMFLNKVDPVEQNSSEQGSSEGFPDEEMHPKHVYKTSCDTYRVQLSKGSRLFPNKKFSRNARTEMDALWLCECALVLIDQPESFRDLLRNGNFQYLFQKRHVSSAEDFALKLVNSVKDLGSRKKLKSTECEQISRALQPILPAYASSETNTTTSSECSDDGLAERTRRSFSSLLSDQWEPLGDVDRRKRRRLPRTEDHQTSMLPLVPNSVCFPDHPQQFSIPMASFHGSQQHVYSYQQSFAHPNYRQCDNSHDMYQSNVEYHLQRHDLPKFNYPNRNYTYEFRCSN